jgi:hypothetical protein
MLVHVACDRLEWLVPKGTLRRNIMVRRLAVLAFVASVEISGTGSVVLAEPFLPDFEAAVFEHRAPVDNPYFPLVEDITRVFTGQRQEDTTTITERFELTTLGRGPTILGVKTTVVRDRAFENNVLVENTLDYYAQDTAGNVWYFGEDVTNFLYDDTGNLVGTNMEGSWRAGVNDALPGFIMPADLTVGFNYYQEFAPNDEALDQGTTNAVGQTVAIDFGTFSNVLKVLETTELDPDFREFKYYAPGQGLVFVEEGLDANLMNPELTFELVSITDADHGDDDMDELAEEDHGMDDDGDDDRHMHDGGDEHQDNGDADDDNDDGDADGDDDGEGDEHGTTPSALAAFGRSRSPVARFASLKDAENGAAEGGIGGAATSGGAGEAMLAASVGHVFSTAELLKSNSSNAAEALALPPANLPLTETHFVHAAVPEPTSCLVAWIASAILVAQRVPASLHRMHGSRIARGSFRWRRCSMCSGGRRRT